MSAATKAALNKAIEAHLADTEGADAHLVDWSLGLRATTGDGQDVWSLYEDSYPE